MDILLILKYLILAKALLFGASAAQHAIAPRATVSRPAASSGTLRFRSTAPRIASLPTASSATRSSSSSTADVRFCVICGRRFLPARFWTITDVKACASAFRLRFLREQQGELPAGPAPSSSATTSPASSPGAR